MTVYGILSDLIGIQVQLQLGYCWTQVNFRWRLCDVRLLLAVINNALPALTNEAYVAQHFAFDSTPLLFLIRCKWSIFFIKS